MKDRLGTAALWFAAAWSGLVFSSREVRVQTTSCFATTVSGDVQGADLGASCAFLGLPFAAAPVGSLRWKPPQPAPPWTPAIFSATAAPPACPNVNPPRSNMTGGSEDCLKLNV